MAAKSQKKIESAQAKSNDITGETADRQIKRLMVIANPGLDQKSLLKRAAQIKAQQGCRVYLFSATTPSTEKTAPTEAARTIEEQLHILAMGYFTSADGLQISAHNVENDLENAADAIVKFAEDNQIDLVLKTAHRSDGTTDCPLDWAINRKLPCNLLILPEAPSAATSATILAAIDIENNDEHQQALNRQILGWAKAMCHGHVNTMTVISAIEISRALLELDMIESDGIESEQPPPLKSQVESLLAEEAITGAKVVISAGDPARKIVSNASSLQAEIVVVGCSGVGELDRLFNGSTAEKIMHQLNAELLIIKE